MRAGVLALALLPALTLTACGDGGDDPADLQYASAQLAREFVLGYRDTVDVGELSLTFSAVVDDSCCGLGSSSVCVWEGNGQILVSATNGEASQVLTLNSNSRFATSAIFAGHVIELRRLDPLPTYQDTGRPSLDEYAATLFVDGWRLPAGG